MRHLTLVPRHELLIPSFLSRRVLLRQTLVAAGAGLVTPALRPAGAVLAQEADANQVPDWDVPGGHFFTQTAPPGSPADSGYILGDSGDLAFWSEYRDRGGPVELGYPLSSRFADGPHAYQVLQGGVLRWNAETGLVDLHPVFASLAQQGMDDWLQSRGVPPTAPALRDDPGLPVDTRLSWLTHPVLAAAYAGSSEEEGRERFGLPMGEPQRFGPYLAQRFERGALQLWLDALPGQPRPGSVTTVQVGELLKEAGLVPQAALAPIRAPAARPAPPPPPPAPVVETPKPQVVPVVQGSGAPGGGKWVVVSLGRQWWWAYQNGDVVFSGPVTTGRPELATPTGRFTIFARFTPYTMYSPWAPGHPFWYPPSSMTYAMQITGNGVFLHDAPWRPYYGPGTNVWHYDPDGGYRTGSHGCINMPFGAAAFLWGWAPNGTPVQVSV
jgi:L,D-transpeptidase catalytic domain